MGDETMTISILIDKYADLIKCVVKPLALAMGI